MFKTILIYAQVCVAVFLFIVREAFRSARLLFGLETLIPPLRCIPKGRVFNVGLIFYFILN